MLVVSGGRESLMDWEELQTQLLSDACSLPYIKAASNAVDGGMNSTARNVEGFFFLAIPTSKQAIKSVMGWELMILNYVFHVDWNSLFVIDKKERVLRLLTKALNIVVG